MYFYIFIENSTHVLLQVPSDQSARGHRLSGGTVSGYQMLMLLFKKFGQVVLPPPPPHPQA